MPDKQDKRDRHGSGSSSSSSTSSSSSISLLDPPDGGWGWVVVFASFIAHMIADGCAFSFGVFYVEFLDYFKESKGKTALVGSLFVACPLITGPIASAFTNRYGCRTTTIVGGFIAGLAFVLSSFTDSIEMLCFTFGVLAGIGLSMVYVPAIVIVAFYFEDKRAFATGVAVAGSGIGTFIFAPLTEFLIQMYTWRGALLIIGGLMFNIMVAGMAFRPLTTPKFERKRRKYLENLGRFSRFSSHTSVHKDCKKPYLHGESNKVISRNSDNTRIQTLLDQPVTHSLMQFPTFMKQELSPLYPDIIKDVGNEGKTLQEVLMQHGLLEKFVLYQSASEMDICTKTKSDSSTQLNGNNKDQMCSSQRIMDQQSNKVCKEDLVWKKLPKTKSNFKRQQELSQLSPLYRKDIFYRGSLLKTGSIVSQKALQGQSLSCPNIAMHYEVESESSSEDNDTYYKFLRVSKEIKSVIRKMMNMAILRSPVFLYFCSSCFLLYFAYDVPYVFTVDRAIEMGISDAKASFLVSIIGITSTVGQIVIGWIGDFPNVNAVHLYNALTSISGVVTIVVPWLSSYGLLAAYCGCFGFFISANYALTTIILVQLIGMDKLTNAYGIVMLFEGLANLVGPPAAGHFTDYVNSIDHGILSDTTGTYDLTFILFGGLMLLSGLMLSAIPCLIPCDKTVQANIQENCESSTDSGSDTEDEVTKVSEFTSTSPKHNSLQNGADIIQKKLKNVKYDLCATESVV